MANDSEHLCMLCGEKEASHEYCDDCLETLRGDYVIASSKAPSSSLEEAYDWVVHVTEEQEQYGYVADAVEAMLSSGRDRVVVWSGNKAQAAPDRCAPDNVPARGSVAPLLVLVEGSPQPLPETWWDELASLVSAGQEELVVLGPNALAEEAPAIILGHPSHPGPRHRPSALAG